MSYISECFIKKYATFSGRASRKEYWLFTLFSLAFIFTCDIALLILFLTGIKHIFYLHLAICVFFYLPGWAVAVRRIHDTGRSGWQLIFYVISIVVPVQSIRYIGTGDSGWHLLLYSISIAGSIWMLMLMCLKGTTGENRFGPDPLISKNDNNLVN